MMLVHKLLRCLPPELAHDIGKKLLAFWQRLPRWGARLDQRGRVLILAGAPNLVFAGRLGVAAGFDKDAEVFAGLARLGFGFVEVGTVTPEPQSGNPKPRLWRVSGQGLVNHMGFNSVGLEAFASNIVRVRSQAGSVCLLANIGKNRNTPIEKAIDDYALCFHRLRGMVGGFVVNLSSPNTPGLRDLQSETFLRELLPHIPEGHPTFVKLSPDLDEKALLALAAFVEETRTIAGLVVGNTSRTLAEKRFGAKAGGYSGPMLYEGTLERIRKVRSAAPKKIVIGVGGIDSRPKAEAALDAGADLIEIYTAFVYQGARLVRQLASV